MKTEIYIATHKKFNLKKRERFIPIQVGAALSCEDLGYIKDNTGDNISEKNKNYCELTAIYWMWKNVKVDNIGLCHYRRYLSKKETFFDTQKYFLTIQDIEHSLQDCDIILPEKNVWKECTCLEFFCTVGIGKKKDMEILRGIVQEKYPEYLGTYDDVMNGHEASYCNVMITSKEKFDAYCEWLFDILFELEKRIDISEYKTVLEARVYGFISELLLNVWVKHNQLNVMYYPLINVEKNYYRIRKIRELAKAILGK